MSKRSETSTSKEVCLDEDTILSFVDHRLSFEARLAAEAHIDVCDECRRLVTETSRENSSKERVTRPSLEGVDIEHFRIGRLIGRGGMGEVYEAFDSKLERRVALKFIAPELVSSREVKERFVREARTTARFNHPNIVAIHSIGEHGESFYLALELVSGVTLRAQLDERRFSLIEGMKVMLAIASALAEAHAHGVLHCDLKPQNVMISEDGRIRVLDFGLAAYAPGTVLALSAHGGGTPAYMAPEQRIRGVVSEYTDVFALGIIGYELLTGKSPQLVAGVDDRRLIPIADESRSGDLLFVPSSLRNMLERCFMLSPESRPTARDFISEVERLLADEATRTLAELSDRVGRWNRDRTPEALLDGGMLEATQDMFEHAQVVAPPAEVQIFSASGLQLHRHAKKRIANLFTIAFLGGLFAVSFAVLAYLAWERSEVLSRSRRIALDGQAAAWFDGARDALVAQDPFEARVRLRSGFEIQDSLLGRLLGWRLEREAVVWSTELGTGLFDVALSPDDRQVALAGQDRTIYLASLETGRMTALRGHRDQVMRVRFSKDGRYLASGSWSGEVRLWDLPQETMRVIEGHQRRIVGIHFMGGTTSGKLLSVDAQGTVVISSVRGSTASVERISTPPSQSQEPSAGSEVIDSDWDERQQRLLLITRSGFLKFVDFPGDSNSINTALPLASEARREAQPSGAGRPDLLRPGTGALEAVAFLGDGTKYGVGDNEGVLHVFDAQQKAWAQKKIHAGSIQRVRYHPNRGTIISSSQSGEIIETSLDLRESRVVTTYAAGVSALDPSVRRPLLATAALNRRARIVSLDTPSPPKNEGHTDGVVAIAFSPDGRIVASGGYDRTIRLVDVQRAQEIAVLRGHQGTIYGLAFDSTGERLASASQDKTVRLWRVGKGLDFMRVGEQSRAERVLTGPTAGVYSVAFSPDGTALAASGADGIIRIFDLQDEVRDHSRAAKGPRSDPAGSSMPSFRIIQPEVGRRGDEARENALENGHENARERRPNIFSVAFHPDGKRLAMAGQDRTVRIFSVATGRELRRWRVHEGPVWSVVFTPGGSELVSGGYDMAVRAFDVENGGSRVIGRQDGRVYSVHVHPDGTRVVASSASGRVRMWSLSSGAALLDFAPHSTEINGVRFSPDGSHFATASDDHTLRLWSLEGAPLWNPPLEATSFDRRRQCVLQAGRLRSHVAGSSAPEFDAPAPSSERLFALATGCVLEAHGQALWFSKPGDVRIVRTGLEVLGISAGSVEAPLLAADANALWGLRENGSIVFRRTLSGVPTALFGLSPRHASSDRIALGFEDGTIDLLHLHGETKSVLVGPASRVTALAGGPMGLLVSGHERGEVVIWDILRERRLESFHLRGRVRSLHVSEKGIEAATDLDLRVFHLNLFERSRCELLKGLREKVKLAAVGPSEDPAKNGSLATGEFCED